MMQFPIVSAGRIAAFWLKPGGSSLAEITDQQILAEIQARFEADGAFLSLARAVFARTRRQLALGPMDI